MNFATQIIQSLLVPELEQDNSFNFRTITSTYWQRFATAFLEYEQDAKPIYALLYELELDNVEEVFNTLPLLYAEFCNQMAESFVLGNNDEATAHLIAAKNRTFLRRVSFFQTLEQAIKKVERENIKSNLPTCFERLNFKVSDVEIENAAKKIGRDDLKSKFKEWDKELEVTSNPKVFYAKKEMPATVTKPKVVSLSWIKYAAVACLVLAGGLWLYQHSNPEMMPANNGYVTVDQDTIVVVEPKSINLPSAETVEALAYDTTENSISVQYPSDLGFTGASNSREITIVFKDASQNIIKLKELISRETTPESTDKLQELRKQLEKLISQEGSYEFDGKKLIIYTSDMELVYTILSQDDKRFYIKMNGFYYHLYSTKVPSQFSVIKDEKLIEKLEKISFENEE